MKFLFRALLLPFAWLYGLILRLRNWLYDVRIKKSRSFRIPVIGIGNLSAGGTGKTPMAEYILDLLLKNGYRPAMLSRGYKRRTTGFAEVLATSIATDAGDEPSQVKKKLPGAMVAVCEDRITGINEIQRLRPDINVIVLDDSFQHRKVKSGVNILLTDYSIPYYSDWLLPAGRLREPVAGRKRADMVVVTKCPERLSAAEKDGIKERLDPFPSQPVFFTSIHYQSLVKTGTGQADSVGAFAGFKFLIFTGIANTKPLEDYLNMLGFSYDVVKFPDHHQYSNADIDNILSRWNRIDASNKILLTTEKDWRRLEGTAEAAKFKGMPLYYLPVSVQWDPGEKLSFDAIILDYVRSNS